MAIKRAANVRKRNRRDVRVGKTMTRSLTVRALSKCPFHIFVYRRRNEETGPNQRQNSAFLLGI